MKFAGVIHQCTRCFSLRKKNGEACETCRVKLNATTTTTQPLALGDISSDAPEGQVYAIGASMGTA